MLKHRVAVGLCALAVALGVITAPAPTPSGTPLVGSAGSTTTAAPGYWNYERALVDLS